MAGTVQASVYFSRDASGYDDLRRKLIPCFDDFYGTALKLIAEWRPAGPIDVLDIEHKPMRREFDCVVEYERLTVTQREDNKSSTTKE